MSTGIKRCQRVKKSYYDELLKFKKWTEHWNWTLKVYCQISGSCTTLTKVVFHSWCLQELLKLNSNDVNTKDS